MKALFRLLALALPALSLAAGGCRNTRALLEAGVRYERPVRAAEGAGPMLAAYADEAGTRVAIEYLVELEGEEETRWVNLDAPEILRALPCEAVGAGNRNEWVERRQVEGRTVYVLSEAFMGKAVSRRPRWDPSSMRRIELRPPARLPAPEGAPRVREAVPSHEEAAQAGASLWACVVMDLPGTGGTDAVLFRFPHRAYREWWGHAVQVLLPAAVALDVAEGTAVFVVVGSREAPELIQFLIYVVCAASGERCYFGSP